MKAKVKMKFTVPGSEWTGDEVNFVRAGLTLEEEREMQFTKSDVMLDVMTRYREEGVEDAFYVCDLGDVVRKLQQWNQLLPRVAPHYAVKCNDDRIVLETMVGLGLGFDCASKSEIKSVLDLGVEPERIIYANPCKQSQHIKFATRHGVSAMTFDNLDELEKIKRHSPDARLVLRILPGQFDAVCNLGVKFGAPMHDVPKLLARARQLQLNIIGVSFHVGSGCRDAAAFPAAVSLARKTFRLAEEAGFRPHLLDIGGGFPGDSSAKVSFTEICQALSPALEEHFPAGSGVEIIAEPGRYFVASAYSLAVNVIARRRPNMDIDPQDLPADESKFMYYVNDGVYGSFNCLLYDHAEVFPIVPGVGLGGELYKSQVFGPTCDGLDCICEVALLPELEVGDWLLFHNMGAYTLAAASSFNGMPQPRRHYMLGDQLVEDVELKERRQQKQRLSGPTTRSVNTTTAVTASDSFPLSDGLHRPPPEVALTAI